MVIRTDKKGFSLVELLVVMGITVFVLAATSKILVTMVTNMKQQSKIAETSIESVVGLEMLRRDIQSAGFGLATGITSGVSTYRDPDWTALADYTEASETNPARFNDAGGGAGYHASADPAPPRAFVSANDEPAWTVNGSDYLVIKGANLGDTPASGKFHTLEYEGAVNTWTTKEPINNPVLDPNLRDPDYVMVISIRDTERIGLVRDSTDDSVYFTQFDDLANFEPPNDREVRLVYGLDSNDPPVAPFNRSDYYISTANVPGQCAPGTGVLVKASMQHADGKLGPERPLLDCVADLQVSYGLDTDDDGEIEAPGTDDLLGYSALEIYEQLKQVRVYVLLHEGRANPRMKFYPDPADPSDTTIYVGEHDPDILGRDFDLSILNATTWNNYKWRVLKLVETPAAMR